MTFVLASQFQVHFLWANAHLAWSLNSGSNVKALVSAFTQEKALVETFSVKVRLQL